MTAQWDRERVRATVYAMPGQTAQEIGEQLELSPAVTGECLRDLELYGSVEAWDDGEGLRWFPTL
jgi:predicted transcriptional regulator